MIKTFPTLYKLDTKGNVREWRMEVSGNKHRSISGLASGEKVVSAWKETFAKNVGKANATTAEEQAVAEVEALYTKRLSGEYHQSINDIQVKRYHKPMLAEDWNDRKDSLVYPVYVQPKLDGIRGIADPTPTYTLASRNGKEIVAAPHITDILSNSGMVDIFDGELYNHQFKDDFNSIVSMIRKTKPTDAALQHSKELVQYHVYDLINQPGVFSERYAKLSQLVNKINHPSIQLVPAYLANSVEEVDAWHAKFLEDGYEGSIIRLNKDYESKRSKYLLKRKDFVDAEFEIIRIEEGQGNWAGYAKRVIIRLPDGREAGAGLAGDREFCRDVLLNADQYVNGQVTVTFFGYTPDGMPRFPIAKALFPGKRDI